MSLPSSPESKRSSEDALNQILSSIAMEELGLSHDVNAEEKKLQYELGTKRSKHRCNAKTKRRSNWGLSVQNSGSRNFTIATEGTPVSLPDVTYIDGFSTDSTNTIFTVENPGVYLISYSFSLWTSTPNQFSIAIKVNETIDNNTLLYKAQGTMADRFPNHTVIINLAAGSTLQLVVSASTEFTALLNNGVNGSLIAVKIA